MFLKCCSVFTGFRFLHILNVYLLQYTRLHNVLHSTACSGSLVITHLFQLGFQEQGSVDKHDALWALRTGVKERLKRSIFDTFYFHLLSTRGKCCIVFFGGRRCICAALTALLEKLYLQLTTRNDKKKLQAALNGSCYASVPSQHFYRA